MSLPVAPVAVVGDAWVEELARSKRDVAERIGGAGLHVAIDLAHLGCPASLVTAMGRDDDAGRIRRRLRRLDVEVLATSEGELPTARVRIEVKKGRTTPAGEGDRRRRIRFDDVQQAVIARAPIVVVAGFPFDDRKQQRRLLATVLQPQNRLVLDANPRTGLLHDPAAFLANLERHASSALLVHLSSQDAELCFEAPLDEATSHLLDLGARHVLATEGSQGARWVNRDGIDVHAPIAAGEGAIVDTSGAGDGVTAVAAAHLARFGPPADEAAAAAILEHAMSFAASIVRTPEAVLDDPERV